MELGQSPTRQEILIHLKNNGGMTVDQLKGSLGISAMGVRQHLAVLERDGLVVSGKQRGRTGRPARVYSLTARGDEAFPRNYDNLAISLLEVIAAVDGAEKVDALFRQRMERLRENYAARISGDDLAQRIEELARLQQENGFMTECGRRPGGFYLIEHNCTVARVAERFPAACRYEIALFESLLGARVRQERCITRGDACCTYFVEAGESPVDGACRKSRRTTSRTTSRLTS